MFYVIGQSRKGKKNNKKTLNTFQLHFALVACVFVNDIKAMDKALISSSYS